MNIYAESNDTALPNTHCSRANYRATSFTFLVVLLLALSSHTLVAQQPINNLKFRHYSVEQGLSQGGIMCMIQDSKGYIWFGTQDGLNRFDGYTFKVFRNDPGNPASISDNYVRSIVEDNQGSLWIGTYGGGLDRYDPLTQTFVHFRHKPNDPSSLSNDLVRCLYKDKQSRIWVGTHGGGLDRFDPATQSFTHYTFNPSDETSLSDNDVITIYQDSKGRIWVGTANGGLNLFDPETEKFERFRYDPLNPSSLSHEYVISILEDNHHRLWVGTRGGGINLFDPTTKQFERFQHNALNPNSLSNDDVIVIEQDRQNRIWIGTYGGGLNLFDPQTKTFSHVENSPTDPYSLSDNIIWSILEDRQGEIWVGTFSNGCNLFDPHSLVFTNYLENLEDISALNGGGVWCITKDRQGRVWIGVDTGGLFLFNPQTNAFKQYLNNPDDPFSLSSNSVVKVLQDHKDRIWIATNGGGLDLFNPQTGSFRHFQHNPGNPATLSENRIFDLIEDHNGKIWIATLTNGLNLFDPETGSFQRFLHDPELSGSLSHNSVTCLLEDAQGRIWVGTRGGGLNLYNPATRDFTHYRYNSNNNTSLSHDYLMDIYQDSKGRLWIATYGGGLNLFDPDTGTSKSWRESEGLSNDAVYSILEDDHGNLWLSTNKGINKFNTETEAFTWYDQQDGLQGNEFNQGAQFKSEDGTMYFGGTNGLSVFYPDSLTDNTFVPPVVITDFLLFNKSVAIGDTTVLDKAADYTREITLSNNDNIFAFEFSALNFRQPEKNRFAYKLEPFNKNWIYTDYEDRKATYTSIPPGSYTFRVKASNDDGYWNEEGTRVKVNVLPPWWLTWWAKTFYVLAPVLLFIAIYRIRVNLLEKQKKELANQVALRTSEISTQNKRLSELNKEKDGILSIVAHDLKSPFNSISGLVSVMTLTSELEPEQKDYLDKINQCVSRGSHLIKDLLVINNFQEDSNAQEFELEKISIDDLFDELKEQHVKLAAAKDQSIRFETSVTQPLTTNRISLWRLLDNLITNAIKYSPKGKPIQVRAIQEDTVMKFHIKDEGPGFSDEDKKKMFGKFQKLSARPTGDETSTGLGLSIVKMIVERLNGTIKVESELGKGSEFIIELPVEPE